MAGVRGDSPQGESPQSPAARPPRAPDATPDPTGSDATSSDAARSDAGRSDAGRPGNGGTENGGPGNGGPGNDGTGNGTEHHPVHGTVSRDANRTGLRGMTDEARRSRLPHLARAFSSAADEKRARRPTDVLMLVLSLLGLLGLSWFAPGPTTVDTSVTDMLASLPGVVGDVWRSAFAALTLWAVFLIVLAALRPGRRRLLGDFALAVVLSMAMAFAGSTAAGTTLATAIEGLLAPEGPPVYVGLRVAVVTAVIVTASPHLAHWMRLIGRGILAIGALAGVALGVALPIGTTAGFLVGLAAAGITHLILGSPGGRPTRQAVAEGLADLGLHSTEVADSPMKLAGSAMFRAEGGPAGALWVKAYGRDAWDGQLLTSTWNALVLRGERPDLSTGRLPRAEHEALACVLAERAGVPVLPVVAVGMTEDEDVLVVTHAPSGPLLAAGVSDEQLTRAWRCVDALHAADIAHGAIGPASLVLDRSGQVALADFAEATIAADERQMRMDDARLLVASALAVGPERALQVALVASGRDALAAMLPYLQPAALDPPARRAVREREWGLKDLARQASALLDATPPALERISRASLAGIGKLVFLGLFGYWIVGFVSDVDWAQVAESFRHAHVADLAVALLMSPIVQVWLALATLGATLVVLRYGPVLMLQYGIQFVGLVIPSSAARVALEVRFFTGWGMGPGPAMTVGMIDSFMGFLVQLALIAIILLSGLVVLSPRAMADASSGAGSDGSGPSALTVLAVLVLVALVAVLLFPSIRRQIGQVLPRAWESVRAQVNEARGALAVLRRPGKIALMVGGNLMAQLTQAVILGLCLAAFGHSESLFGLILVNTFVSLFAGFMPVPGGMGVAEAGYTAGLQALGVPSDVAVSTAIMFRMVTFYLPPIWGSLAMRWLRRHEYV